MRRLVAFLASPRTQVAFNGAAMCVWLAMLPVTLLDPSLRNAILWVAFMSVWANFATHLGGWIAALVNVRAERIDRANLHDKLDHIIEHHPDIPPLPESDAA